METDTVKTLFIKFVTPLSVVIGIIGRVVTVSLALSDVSKWALGFFAFGLVIFLSLLLFLYVTKSREFRLIYARFRELVQIFEKTHNTWHIYKRLSDSMHSGIELDDVRQKIHSHILNLVSNFRDSLVHLHPGQSFGISIKGIQYKNLSSLDGADGESYREEPFVLIDLPLFRDAGQGPVRQDQVIDRLDFDDTTNHGELVNLRETLFWQSFQTRNVEYVASFTEAQQRYTTRFKSGMVAPVVLHEIPFAFICIGCQDTDVFGEDDLQVACTFADAIAEFIRLERIFHAIAQSTKIVVMKDKAKLLEEIDKLRTELLEDRRKPDELDTGQ